ncbi:MAG: nucleotidyltransferase domain-containing protein, partial [Acidobacteriota bacterium]
ALLEWIDRVRDARGERRSDARRRGELVDMLVAGGATAAASAPGRVIQALGEAGVFRLGGVLVGTYGFLALGNALGIRFGGRHLRTEDVDIAHDLRLAVALGPTDSPVDVPEALAGVDQRFFGVPGLDPRQPSASFKVRGRDLRVDFLTSRSVARGRRSPDGLVELRRFGVAAQPLPFLGYLLENTIQAVVLYDSGVLVNVPQPARFALHKIWLAGRRPAAMQARARKDLAQAEALLGALLEDRPRGLERAWGAVPAKRRGQVREGLRRLGPRLREAVATAAQMEPGR